MIRQKTLLTSIFMLTRIDAVTAPTNSRVKVKLDFSPPLPFVTGEGETKVGAAPTNADIVS